MSTTTYTDAEEMLDALAKMQADAKAVFDTIPQTIVRALVPGKFALLDAGEYGIPVFYELIESKYEEDREHFAEHPELVLARGYSIACPEGEIGTLYLASLLPISPDFFAEAKASNWDLPPEEAQLRAETYARNLLLQLD